MTAAKKFTEYEIVIKRLRMAASDLEDAANSAMDAVHNIDPTETDTGAGRADLALAQLVLSMHGSEHDGPLRWCRHDVCQKAEQILN